MLLGGIFMSYDLDQLGDYLTKLLNGAPKGSGDEDLDSYDGPDSDSDSESGEMAGEQDSSGNKPGSTPATAQGPAARLNRAKYYTQKPDDDIKGNKVYQGMYGGKFHCTSDCGRFLYNVAKPDDPKLPEVIIKDIKSHILGSKDWISGRSATGGMRAGDLLIRNTSHGALYGGAETVQKNGKPVTRYVTYEASLNDHNPIKKYWPDQGSIQRYYGTYARPKREGK